MELGVVLVSLFSLFPTLSPFPSLRESIIFYFHFFYFFFSITPNGSIIFNFLFFPFLVMCPSPQDKYHLILSLLFGLQDLCPTLVAKRFSSFCSWNIILHSKVDIIFGEVNIKDNDSLITIIHKGAQTLISDNKKCECGPWVFFNRRRGKVGAKHLLEMNIFVWISPCVMIILE